MENKLIVAQGLEGHWERRLSSPLQPPVCLRDAETDPSPRHQCHSPTTGTPHMLPGLKKVTQEHHLRTKPLSREYLPYKCAMQSSLHHLTDPLLPLP